MIIKVLLIGAAVWLGVQVLRDRVPGQHLALRRILGISITLTAIIAVLWPDLTVVAANAVGVRRGTDLVLYCLVVVFIYNAIATAQRIHKLEQLTTTLARELALKNAAESAAGMSATEPASALD